MTLRILKTSEREGPRAPGQPREGEFTAGTTLQPKPGLCLEGWVFLVGW